MKFPKCRIGCESHFGWSLLLSWPLIVMESKYCLEKLFFFFFAGVISALESTEVYCSAIRVKTKTCRTCTDPAVIPLPQQTAVALSARHFLCHSCRSYSWFQVVFFQLLSALLPILCSPECFF